MSDFFYYQVCEDNNFAPKTCFNKGNLLNMRRQAIDYYRYRLEALTAIITPPRSNVLLSKSEARQFLLRNNFLKLYLVENTNGAERNYCLIGGAEHEVTEGRKIEMEVFKKIGLVVDPNDLLV